MRAPQVSVVTSVYNGERYLRSSLESILAQQGVEFEFLVIDDGCTDSAPTILAELARRDARLRVLRQENQGLTQALIRGCAEARGEFIARHDADDLSQPGRLARQAERLRADPSLSMVSCWVQGMGPEGETLYESRGFTDADEATDRLLNRYRGPTHGSVMFRKTCYEQVGGYRPEFYLAQDADLWLRLGEAGGLSYEPAFLYAFRVTEANLSARHRALQDRLGELSHECQAARRAGRPESELLAQAARLRPRRGDASGSNGSGGAYFIGQCLLRRGDPRAGRYFRKVLALRPWNAKAWMGLVRSAVVSLLSTF